MVTKYPESLNPPETAQTKSETEGHSVLGKATGRGAARVSPPRRKRPHLLREERSDPDAALRNAPSILGRYQTKPEDETCLRKYRQRAPRKSVSIRLEKLPRRHTRHRAKPPRTYGDPYPEGEPPHHLRSPGRGVLIHRENRTRRQNFTAENLTKTTPGLRRQLFLRRTIRFFANMDERKKGDGDQHGSL